MSCELTIGVFWIIKNICNLNRFAFQQDAANYTVAPRFKCYALLAFNECRRVSVGRCGVVAGVPGGSKDYALVGFGQTCGQLQDRVEYFRQIKTAISQHFKAAQIVGSQVCKLH